MFSNTLFSYYLHETCCMVTSNPFKLLNCLAHICKCGVIYKHGNHLHVPIIHEYIYLGYWFLVELL